MPTPTLYNPLMHDENNANDANDANATISILQLNGEQLLSVAVNPNENYLKICTKIVNQLSTGGGISENTKYTLTPYDPNNYELLLVTLGVEQESTIPNNIQTFKDLYNSYLTAGTPLPIQQIIAEEQRKALIIDATSLYRKKIFHKNHSCNWCFLLIISLLISAGVATSLSASSNIKKIATSSHAAQTNYPECPADDLNEAKKIAGCRPLSDEAQAKKENDLNNACIENRGPLQAAMSSSELENICGSTKWFRYTGKCPEKEWRSHCDKVHPRSSATCFLNITNTQWQECGKKVKMLEKAYSYSFDSTFIIIAAIGIFACTVLCTNCFVSDLAKIWKDALTEARRNAPEQGQGQEQEQEQALDAANEGVPPNESEAVF